MSHSPAALPRGLPEKEMIDPEQSFARAHEFLNSLAESPPLVPYEPELLPLLFDATRDNSTATLRDVAKLVERSQNLATRLLNIANSAYYVLEFKVTSLERAISVLGLREIRSLVLMVGMVAAIKGVRLPVKFDAHALWRHHIRTASLAKAMTDALRSEAAPPGGGVTLLPDEAYVAGLLHDLGKVFLASAKPGIWEEIEALRAQRECTFAEAESAYWGIDHGIVAARVLHVWRLPLLLTDAISWHHAPDLAPEGGQEAGLLAAANALAHTGYSPGDVPAAEILALLPPGVNGQILAEALGKRMAEDKENALLSML
jgi:HD-like signal output (HDOD) protein